MPPEPARLPLAPAAGAPELPPLPAALAPAPPVPEAWPAEPALAAVALDVAPATELEFDAVAVGGMGAELSIVDAPDIPPDAGPAITPLPLVAPGSPLAPAARVDELRLAEVVSVAALSRQPAVESANPASKVRRRHVFERKLAIVGLAPPVHVLSFESNTAA